MRNCETCLTNSASVRCVDCSRVFCSQCFEQLHWFKRTSHSTQYLDTSAPVNVNVNQIESPFKSRAGLFVQNSPNHQQQQQQAFFVSSSSSHILDSLHTSSTTPIPSSSSSSSLASTATTTLHGYSYVSPNKLKASPSATKRPSYSPLAEVHLDYIPSLYYDSTPTTPISPPSYCRASPNANNSWFSSASSETSSATKKQLSFERQGDHIDVWYSKYRIHGLGMLLEKLPEVIPELKSANYNSSRMTEEDARKQFLRLAKKMHPDKLVDTPKDYQDKCSKLFPLLHSAYKDLRV